MREYTGPNTLLSAFKLIRQAIKSASPAAGEGLSKEGDTLSVTTPVRSIVTQAEFDALTEAQRNKGLFVISDGGTGDGGGGESAGEVYSTEETRIGTWIDGKPLYRITLTGSVSVSISATLKTIASGESIHLKRVYGNITSPSAFGTPWIQGIPTVQALSGSAACFIVVQQNQKTKDIEIRSRWDSPGTFLYEAVLEYTKTTDEGGNA